MPIRDLVAHHREGALADVDLHVEETHYYTRTQRPGEAERRTHGAEHHEARPADDLAHYPERLTVFWRHVKGASAARFASANWRSSLA